MSAARVGDAYRVLFSLFPLAIFLVSIFSLMIQNAEPRHEIVTWLVDNLLLSPEGSVRLNEAAASVCRATPNVAEGREGDSGSGSRGAVWD